MKHFNERGTDYSGVNAYADGQGLAWDGHVGSPYEIDSLTSGPKLDRAEARRFERLFDHTIRFKPRGSGSFNPVLAISSPYPNHLDPASREEQIAKFAEDAQEFATRFGLSVRVNDGRDRIYKAEESFPILFWRADLHPLR